MLAVWRGGGTSKEDFKLDAYIDELIADNKDNTAVINKPGNDEGASKKEITEDVEEDDESVAESKTKRKKRRKKQKAEPKPESADTPKRKKKRKKSSKVLSDNDQEDKPSAEAVKGGETVATEEAAAKLDEIAMWWRRYTKVGQAM